MHRKYKQKTVKRKIASVKAFYKYLEDAEKIYKTGRNPARAAFEKQDENSRSSIKNDCNIEKK